MFNNIVQNIKNSPEAYDYLVDAFSTKDGPAYKLVAQQYQDPIFIDFKDINLIQASEIIKGFKLIMKLEAHYRVQDQTIELSFALESDSNKSFTSIKIKNIVMK